MDPFADVYTLSDAELMERIGDKIRTIRLNDNITQSVLQNITGVHRKTIGEAESGNGITVATLIAILRGLNMLDLLDPLIREEEISPLQIAELQGNVPQRARGKR